MAKTLQQEIAALLLSDRWASSQLPHESDILEALPPSWASATKEDVIEVLDYLTKRHAMLALEDTFGGRTVHEVYPDMLKDYI